MVNKKTYKNKKKTYKNKKNHKGGTNAAKLGKLKNYDYCHGMVDDTQQKKFCCSPEI